MRGCAPESVVRVVWQACSTPWYHPKQHKSKEQPYLRAPQSMPGSPIWEVSSPAQVCEKLIWLWHLSRQVGVRLSRVTDKCVAWT